MLVTYSYVYRIRTNFTKKLHSLNFQLITDKSKTREKKNNEISKRVFFTETIHVPSVTLHTDNGESFFSFERIFYTWLINRVCFCCFFFFFFSLLFFFIARRKKEQIKNLIFLLFVDFKRYKF